MKFYLIGPMKYLPLYLFLFFAFAAQLTGNAQQIDSMMNAYAEGFPRERIHLHFDKTAYNKEETIWYKAYIMDDQGLTQLSKNLYVEWYDTSGKMIRQTAAPLFQSTAKGAFELPADYKGNFIRVKAYTQWSLNDDPAFRFTRDIIINNTDEIDINKLNLLKTTLELFPEGGDLVTGLTSKVAFKARDNRGLPVSFKGFLINDKNKTLDTLKIQHDGMGFFQLQPKAGEKYFVKWTDKHGNTGTTALPSAKNEGVTLSLKTSNEFAALKIERTAQVPANMKTMILLVHMNQLVLFKVALNAVDRTLLTANIPIAELNTGVLQFTLFSSDWLPLAERVVYVNNRNHEFGAKILTQLTTLTKRGKNVLDVYVADTTSTNLSISITDASIESENAPHTIYSDLLLSSEIKGKIHHPGYYLSSDADSVTAHLDLVMLTHAWRRFNWDSLKAGKGPVITHPFDTEKMRLSGKVFGLKSVSVNEIMMNLILQYKDSSRNFLFQPVNKEGYFENRELFFYDTAKIFYSFNQNQRLNDVTQVQFENGLLKPQAKSIVYEDAEKLVNWNDSIARARMNQFLAMQEEWKKRSSYKTLQEVIVKSRAKPKEDEIEKRYASGLFAGGDAFVFDIANDPAASAGFDILNYLQGRVPGLQITRAGMNGVSMQWRGAVPEVFIDQMPVSPDMVMNISIRDIAMVKVFRPPFFGSMGGGGGGAIAIYTRKGGDTRTDNSKSSKGMLSAILSGYTRFKEFYNPQYDNPAENPETDIRTTLYWNPYVITNKKSPRFRIQFYNNDISKKLLVVLEGVNADGKMTRVTKLIE
ncbi:MAG: hypothetical protein RJB03_130 [Bacteroidota bacterium]|jgi:hypothetical protein